MTDQMMPNVPDKLREETPDLPCLVVRTFRQTDINVAGKLIDIIV